MREAQGSNLLKVAGQCGCLQTNTEHHLTIVWKMRPNNYSSPPHTTIFHSTLTALLALFFKSLLSSHLLPCCCHWLLPPEHPHIAPAECLIVYHCRGMITTLLTAAARAQTTCAVTVKVNTAHHSNAWKFSWVRNLHHGQCEAKVWRPALDNAGEGGAGRGASKKACVWLYLISLH